jgi:hypothetical protein
VYWLLRTCVRERASLGFHRSPLFRGQGDLSHRALQGNRSHGPEKTGLYGQQAIRGGMRRPHQRAAKGLLRHDATNWMDLIHQLDARTRGPASGCPAVVMVQSTHDRTSDHLVPCMMRGHGWSAWSRKLLLDPLMRSCLVARTPQRH